MMGGEVSQAAQRSAVRVAAARKAAATRKRLAALRAFRETGAPVGERPEQGSARGDFSPTELIERIRARQADATRADHRQDE
jgi:hypothetical protein